MVMLRKTRLKIIFPLLLSFILMTFGIDATSANDSINEKKGGIYFGNSKTRLIIGGFAQLDVIRDSGPISTPCDFITADIQTRDKKRADGSSGRGSYCISQSQIWIESGTPTKIGYLGTFLSFDFFGEPEGTKPSFRLREFYGEMKGLLFGGDLKAGQMWSLYADVNALPQMADFEGPQSGIIWRQPAIHWIKEFGRDFVWKVGAEDPDSVIIEGADAQARWPSFITSITFGQSQGYLRLAGIFRSLRASLNNGPIESAVGWGFNFTGVLAVPKIKEQDNFRFSIQIGDGIGYYFADQLPDAIYNTDNSSLEKLPLFGVYVSFEHFWTSNLRSNVVYSFLDAKNTGFQAGDAYNHTHYFALNLIWNIYSTVMLGAEYLWGKRVDKDLSEGAVNRLDLSLRVTY
jgi:hypothetical protein